MTDTAKFKTDDGLAELHRLEETRRDLSVEDGLTFIISGGIAAPSPKGRTP